MKIYRVSYYSLQESSEGFSFHSSRRVADKALNEYKKQMSEKEGDWEDEDGDYDAGRSMVEEIEFKPTKKDIIATFTQYACHNDNG